MSWKGDFIGLPDLIMCGYAFTSMIISLRALSDGCIFEARTVSTSDSVSFVDL